MSSASSVVLFYSFLVPAFFSIFARRRRFRAVSCDRLARDEFLRDWSATCMGAERRSSAFLLVSLRFAFEVRLRRIGGCTKVRAKRSGKVARGNSDTDRTSSAATKAACERRKRRREHSGRGESRKGVTGTMKTPRRESPWSAVRSARKPPPPC